MTDEEKEKLLIEFIKNKLENINYEIKAVNDSLDKLEYFGYESEFELEDVNCSTIERNKTITRLNAVIKRRVS